MTTPTLFKEYIWLVNTINQARSITLSDINKKWLTTEMSGGVELARSTFNRHKVAIEDIFGIRIECDRSKGYTYSIGNVEVLGNESVQNWMLSTLSVNNIISESLSLHSRILLESIPSADERLEKIITAMKKDRLLQIVYGNRGDRLIDSSAENLGREAAPTSSASASRPCISFRLKISYAALPMSCRNSGARSAPLAHSMV